MSLDKRLLQRLRVVETKWWACDLGQLRKDAKESFLKTILYTQNKMIIKKK